MTLNAIRRILQLEQEVQRLNAELAEMRHRLGKQGH